MVAGQVTASEVTLNNVDGFPSEDELAKKVMKLPERVHGKLLVEDSEIAPVNEAGKLIKLSFQHGRWKFLSTTDTFSLVDVSGEPFADGAHIVVQSNIVGRNTHMMLKNKDDEVIAMAVQERLAINKHYNIYGTKPLLEGGEINEDGKTWYPWFRVRDIDDNHLEYRSLLVWNGNNFQPMMRIYPAMRFPNKPGISDLIPPSKGDNIVCDAEDKRKMFALMSKKCDRKMAGWDLVIAPGTDPAAMILLAAVMDDMVGWFA